VLMKNLEITSWKISKVLMKNFRKWSWKILIANNVLDVWNDRKRVFWFLKQRKFWWILVWDEIIKQYWAFTW
jgi:hypothetical protein